MELACGDGSLARAIQDFGWLSYSGLDISSEAISRASSVSGQDIRFRVQDMEGWVPDEDFDLLIIEEALYYLPTSSQDSLLDRAFAAMGPAGTAIIALHSRVKFAAMIDRLEKRYPVRQKVVEGNRCYLVLGASRAAG